MTQPLIRVAIIEDLPRIRAALTTLVERATDCRVAGAFDAMEPALEALRGGGADVVLADIGLPGMSGIEGVRLLKAAQPDMQILMLTVYDDNRNIFEAMCAGASGYLLKDTAPKQLLQAVRDVHAGGAPMTPEIARKVVTMFQRIPPPAEDPVHLSPRDLDVLRVLAEGHSYKTAAVALDVSIDNIRFYVRRIYTKLHVHSKSEAVLKAFQTGLLR